MKGSGGVASFKAPEVVYMDLSEVAYLMFWGCVMVMATSFAAASLGGAIPYPRYARFGYSYTPPLYTINPIDCNMNLYWNYNTSLLYTYQENVTSPRSTPYHGVWNLWIRYGACPTEHLPSSCRVPDVDNPQNYCGEYYTNCMSMYFQRQQMQNDFIPGSETWAKTYFHTPYDWGDLDNDNRLANYNSQFVQGSRVWDSLANLAIAATTLMYVGLVIFVFSIFFKVCLFQSRVITVVLYFFSCISWCIVLGLPSKTSQLDPKAWSTTFFKSCTVVIENGPIYYYVTFLIASTGAFVLSEVGFFLYYHYFDTSRTFRPVSSMEMKDGETRRRSVVNV